MILVGELDYCVKSGFSLAGVSTPKIFRAHCHVGNMAKKKGLVTLNSPPYCWPTTEMLGKEKYIVFAISLRQVIFHKLHSRVQSLIVTIFIITKCSSELLQVSRQISMCVCVCVCVCVSISLFNKKKKIHGIRA